MRPLSRGTITMHIIGVLLSRRAQHLPLGIARACDPCVTVLGRHDRGDLFISSRSRSVRYHRRWFRYGRFDTRGREARLLHRAALPDGPPYHWAAIRGSGGMRRLWCGPYPCTPPYSRGMVAGVVRRAWRHRRPEHRLGECVDVDRPRSPTGRCAQPYSATEWADNRGRVTMRVRRISVGMTLTSGRRC